MNPIAAFRRLLLGPALLATLVAGSARSQSFQPGDLVLVSQGLTINGSFASSGVVRIRPCAGTADLVLQLQGLFGSYSAFDAFRGGVVLGGLMPGTLSGGEILVVKADGTFDKTGVSAGGIECIAAAGDGRVYLVRTGGSMRFIEYLDAANVTHNVLDASGSAPFAFVCCGVESPAFFDAASNALWFGSFESGAACGFGFTTSRVIKVPLTPDGSQVAGPIQTATICPAAATNTAGVVNLSVGPGNTLLAVLDDNSNGAVGRMVTIDRTTLAVSSYAANGSYVGAAATNAGAFSHMLGRAVILDTFNDTLRIFGAGETGGGTPWISGPPLSGNGGSGELAFLIEVPSAVASGLAPYGTGTPGCAGAHALFASQTPKVGAADFRFTCTAAPPSALGLLIVGDVPNVAGVDLFGLGFLLHVDLLTSTFLTGLDVDANALGVAQSPAPIPIQPTFVGATIDAQALWVWSGCATPSPFGVSTSNGLAVTFQN